MTESMMERATLAVVTVWQKSDNQVGAVLDCAAVARAVIEAMREPTERMIDAGAVAEGSGNLAEEARNIWGAMTAAALIWPAGSADIAGVPMAKD